MVQELLELQNILQHEGYDTYEVSYKEMEVKCQTFGTKFKIKFLKGNGVECDKDTYIIITQDEFQSFCASSKGEVLTLLFFVYHSIAE